MEGGTGRVWPGPCTEQGVGSRCWMEPRRRGRGRSNGFLLHTCNHLIWAREGMQPVRGDKPCMVQISSWSSSISPDWSSLTPKAARRVSTCPSGGLSCPLRTAPAAFNCLLLLLIAGPQRENNLQMSANGSVQEASTTSSSRSLKNASNVPQLDGQKKGEKVAPTIILKEEGGREKGKEGGREGGNPAVTLQPRLQSQHEGVSLSTYKSF